MRRRLVGSIPAGLTVRNPFLVSKLEAMSRIGRSRVCDGRSFAMVATTEPSNGAAVTTDLPGPSDSSSRPLVAIARPLVVTRSFDCMGAE